MQIIFIDNKNLLFFFLIVLNILFFIVIVLNILFFIVIFLNILFFMVMLFWCCAVVLKKNAKSIFSTHVLGMILDMLSYYIIRIKKNMHLYNKVQYPIIN